MFKGLTIVAVLLLLVSGVLATEVTRSYRVVNEKTGECGYVANTIKGVPENLQAEGWKLTESQETCADLGFIDVGLVEKPYFFQKIINWFKHLFD